MFYRIHKRLDELEKEVQRIKREDRRIFAGLINAVIIRSNFFGDATILFSPEDVCFAFFHVHCLAVTLSLNKRGRSMKTKVTQRKKHGMISYVALTIEIILILYRVSNTDKDCQYWKCDRRLHHLFPDWHGNGAFIDRYNKENGEKYPACGFSFILSSSFFIFWAIVVILLLTRNIELVP